MTIKSIETWFKQAVPAPDNKTLGVQLGCHFEEVAEMLTALKLSDSELQSAAIDALERLADALKFGQCAVASVDNIDLLDSICDQQVTGTGVGYMLGMNVAGALTEVNRSNYSKFENGQPVFNENGKIAKGKDYAPPDLTPFL